MRLFTNGLGVGGNVLPENFQDVFDSSKFQYSIDYSTGIRAAASVYKFSYSGTTMTIKANPTIYASYPQFSQLIIFVNGSYQETITVVNSTTEYTVTFTSGDKTIEIVEAALSKPSSIIGVFLTYLYLDANRYSILTEGALSEKIVFLGDSITVGANANAPSIEGFASLFRYTDNRPSTILGYGFGTVQDFASTTPLIDTTVGWFTSQFISTTTKKVVIALGTNDFALDSTPAATFETWYGNLLDAINTADASIEVFCISPLLRSSDGALLDDYRTAIGGLCSSRLWCTHIAGKSILTLSDLDDGVHPTTAGHLKYYDAIKTTI